MSTMEAGQVQETGAIRLPPPEKVGGIPLMQALKARHSAREFDGRALPLQVLSNLLWAANGVNRAGTGQRTAPSARDWRETDVLVITARACIATIRRRMPCPGWWPAISARWRACRISWRPRR